MSHKIAHCKYLLTFACWPMLALLAPAQNATVPIAPQTARGIGTAFNAEPSKTQEILDFWTPERLSSARPMPIPVLDKADSETAKSLVPKNAQSGGAPGGRPSIHVGAPEEAATEEISLNQGDEGQDSEAAPPPTFNYVYPYNNYRTGVNSSYPYSTVGKLFFQIPSGATLPPGEYVCTASVAMNSYTLVTARQCMYDVNTGKWYGSFVFYPGWKKGKNNTLGGAWTGRYAWTWPQGYSNYYYDIGFIALNDHNGTGCDNSSKSHQIGYYTGWLGYWYGEDYSQMQWAIMGYPQTSPYDGNYLYQDNAATASLNTFGYSGTVGVGNPQSAGLNGGPWIMGFDPSNSTDPSVDNVNNNKNMVNSVNSYKTSTYNQLIVGPEFESNNFNNLYGGYLANNGCK